MLTLKPPSLQASRNAARAAQVAVPQHGVEHSVEFDSSKLSCLEARLNEVDLQLGDSIRNVLRMEQRMADVYALLETNAEVYDKLKESNAGGSISARGEISNLQCQVASLQAVVDRDVLDAFRRLRQKSEETAIKVDRLLADSVPAFVDVDFNALENRLTTSLTKRIEEFRLETFQFDLQGLEERLSSTLLKRMEGTIQDISRELRELSVYVDARVAPPAQEKSGIRRSLSCFGLHPVIGYPKLGGMPPGESECIGIGDDQCCKQVSCRPEPKLSMQDLPHSPFSCSYQNIARPRQKTFSFELMNKLASS